MTITDKIPAGSPSNANEALFDALVRHQVYIMRLSGATTNNVITILNETEAEIANKIRERLLNAKGGLTSQTEVKRLETLLKSVIAIRNEAWDKVETVLLQEATELALAEPISLNKTLAITSPVILDAIMPSKSALKAIVDNSAFEGLTIKEWAKNLRADDLRRINDQIRVGTVLGESSSKIAQRIVGTARLNGKDGVTQITRNRAEAITRTATNHIANQARTAFLLENKNLFESEQFVATLDSGTTAICRSLDGKIYPVGIGYIPPLHFRCRSERVAVFDGNTLSERPAKASTEKQLLREYTAKNGLAKVSKRGDLPYGTKTSYDAFARKRIRELTGQVPASVNYQEWLGRQSVQFQDDTLGITKAKLFRDGKLTLDKFVSRKGDELTLQQLAVREAEAFKAAGLNPDEFI